MSVFDVRIYRESDEPAVIGLWQECGLIMPWNNPQADISRKCVDSPELFFVASAAGKIIASCMAGYDGHRGWIYYLAVTESWQRRGVATAMMEHAENRLRDIGCPKIDLMVRNNNDRVIAFYHNIGYADDPVVVLSKRLDTDEPHDFA